MHLRLEPFSSLLGAAIVVVGPHLAFACERGWSLVTAIGTDGLDGVRYCGTALTLSPLSLPLLLSSGEHG